MSISTRVPTRGAMMPAIGATNIGARVHGVVWIADTDAHAILRLETRSGALHHIPIGE